MFCVPNEFQRERMQIKSSVCSTVGADVFALSATAGRVCARRECVGEFGAFICQRGTRKLNSVANRDY